MNVTKPVKKTNKQKKNKNRNGTDVAAHKIQEPKLKGKTYKAQCENTMYMAYHEMSNLQRSVQVLAACSSTPHRGKSLNTQKH